MSEVTSDDIFQAIVFIGLFIGLTALEGYVIVTYAPIDMALRWIISGLLSIVILVVLWFAFKELDANWWD